MQAMKKIRRKLTTSNRQITTVLLFLILTSDKNNNFVYLLGYWFDFHQYTQGPMWQNKWKWHSSMEIALWWFLQRPWVKMVTIIWKLTLKAFTLFSINKQFAAHGSCINKLLLHLSFMVIHGTCMSFTETVVSFINNSLILTFYFPFREKRIMFFCREFKLSITSIRK